MSDDNFVEDTGDTTPKVTKKKKVSKKPKTAKPETGAKDAAVKILKKRYEDEAKKKIQAVVEEEANTLFFMRCPRDREHHAVYFTENPNRKAIHPGMWFSIYHDVDEPWGIDMIWCQECALMGRKRKTQLMLRPSRNTTTGMVTFMVPDSHAARAIDSLDRSEMKLFEPEEANSDG